MPHGTFSLPRHLQGIEGAFQRQRSPEALTLLLTFDNGRIYAESLNQRLTKRDVAKILRTTEDGVAFLSRRGYLKPLGHPNKAKQRLFAASELMLLMQDRRWLGKITDALYEHVGQKNAAQRKRKQS